MDSPTAHSFIIRLWLEEADSETGLVKWRGHVTHVMSQQRRYIENLEDIKAFISACLENRSADVNP